MRVSCEWKYSVENSVDGQRPYPRLDSSTSVNALYLLLSAPRGSSVNTDVSAACRGVVSRKKGKHPGPQPAHGVVVSCGI